MNGGYKIIDLHDVNMVVGGSGVTISGVYDAIENNYRKPTLLTGITIGGIERTSRFVYFGVDNGNYVGVLGITPDVYTLHITITSDDLVILTEI